MGRCCDMFRCWRWAPCARLEFEFEDGRQYAVHTIPLRKRSSIVERNPGALILSIAALHLFVNPLLYISLQYPRPRRLVVIAHFQDMRRVDVIIGPTAHHTMSFDIEFKDRNLLGESANGLTRRRQNDQGKKSGRRLDGE